MFFINCSFNELGLAFIELEPVPQTKHEPLWKASKVSREGARASIPSRLAPYRILFQVPAASDPDF